MPSYNREGSKVRQAALAIVAPAVAALTLPDHADTTAINCYDAHTARKVRAGGATTEAQKQLPCISFKTLDGAEITKTTNNKRVPLIITVESSADADEDLADDDPEGNHEAICAAAFDVINDEDIAATLSAAVGDFYCYDVIDMGELDVEAEEGRFITAHRWDVICTNNSLA